MIFNPVQRRLELLHQFVHTRGNGITEEVIDGQIPIPITSTAATSTAAPATGSIGRVDDVQFIEAHQVAFQLLRRATCAVKIVTQITNTRAHIADNARIIHFGEGESEQRCDCRRQDADSLCKCDNHGKYRIENRYKYVTERTSGLRNLSFQNAKLIRRCIQGSCHIALCGRNLSHDRVVSKLCFLSLSHARKGLVDTKAQRNCFQSRLTQIVTKSTKRFKLTRNTRLQLLHGICIADVEEGTQVVAQLSQVLTHDVRTVTHHAEARSQGHENTLITHPLAGVNTHDLTNVFGILLCFRSKLPHGSIEKVQVFYIFVRLIDEFGNRPTNRLNSRDRHAKSCVEVHVRTCRRSIRSSQAVRARDYLLNPMRKCREPAGNRVHLRCEGL